MKFTYLHFLNNVILVQLSFVQLLKFSNIKENPYFIEVKYWGITTIIL